MLVEEMMQRELITIGLHDTVLAALTVAKANRIRHLPVVEGETLLGIVSDRDLRDVSPSVLCPSNPDVLEKTPVSRIMKTDVITVHPLDTMDEAARLMYQHHIGCLPVVSEGKLVGLITERDLLHTLVEMMGGTEPGSTLRVAIPHRPGTLADVAGIIRARGVNILGVLIAPAREEDRRVLVIRVQTIHPLGVARDIAAAGYQVLWPVLPEEGL